MEFPVLTFSSGPTNSMRGAAHLSKLKDAIVVDIGGTTTDVGVLCNGFPRQSSTRVKVISYHLLYPPIIIHPFIIFTALLLIRTS